MTFSGRLPDCTQHTDATTTAFWPEPCRDVSPPWHETMWYNPMIVPVVVVIVVLIGTVIAVVVTRHFKVDNVGEHHNNTTTAPDRR